MKNEQDCVERLTLGQYMTYVGLPSFKYIAAFIAVSPTTVIKMWLVIDAVD